MASAADTVANVIIQYNSVGLDKTTADVKAFENNLDNLTVSFQSSERASASLENRFKSLERQFSTTEGNADKFAKVQDAVNKAVAQNPLLQERGDQILAQAAVRYGQVAEATKKAADAHAGLDAQGQAALHSIRSFTEQLAMGAPVTQALTGQLNHLTFAASGEGGLVGAFKQVGSLVGGVASGAAAFATSSAGIVAGIGAITVAAGALALQWDNVQKASERALIGAGRRTGTSISDINAFVQQTATPTGLSQKEARTLGEDFTKTGDIVISRLHDMGTAVVGFAELSGKSMDEAGKELVKFATDPKKALDELAQTYGAFDPATRKAVEALTIAGDKTGAFQVEMDALAQKNKEAAGTMGLLEKATRSVINLLATPVAKPVGLEQQIQDTTARLNKAIESAPDMLVPAEASENIRKLSDELIVLQNAMEKVRAQKAADEFNDIADKGQKAVEAITPQIAALATVNQKLAELKEAKDAGMDPAPIDRATVAYENQKKALEDSKQAAVEYNDYIKQLRESYQGVSDKVVLQLEALKDDLRLAKAVTDQQKESAQRAKDYSDARRAGAKDTEASEIAAGKAAIRAAEANKTAAAAALEWQQNMLGVSASAQAAADASVRAAEAFENAARAAQGTDLGRGGDFGSFNVPAGTQYTSVSPWTEPMTSKALESGDFTIMPGTIGTLIPTQQGLDKQAAQQKAQQQTAALTNSIDKLTTSTDNLNKTNQDLLSPYYTQDPRTTHIGFRSQGMAAGGYVDVPGGYSTADNLIAQIPVASGERIYIDPMTQRRGIGGQTSISITAPIVFSGNVNKDEVGRTVYQTMQQTARSLAAASR